MELRTYYWNTRQRNFLKYHLHKIRNPFSLVLRFGNAGDIYNKDLVNYYYNIDSVNVPDEGERLLQVGSVMKVVRPGDVLNGIGWKGDQHLDISNFNGVDVFGVRGPLTYDYLKGKGVDVSKVKFLFDPGLLVKEIYQPKIIDDKDSKPIFIPHYRDIIKYQGKYPEGMRIVNIDSEPKSLIDKIAKSSVVYSSSLHGVIFAHALGKPCFLVHPQTEEPMLKYEDYYLSIGSQCPVPMDNIFDKRIFKDHELLPDLKIDLNDFYVPSVEYLTAKKIITY